MAVLQNLHIIPTCQLPLPGKDPVMAVWGLSTTSPFSLPSLSPPSCFGATRTTSNFCSVSSIAYPALSYSYSTTLHVVKSANYNVQVLGDEDEPDETLINRFRREVLNAGVLQECRRRRFFETPQDKIKRKAREASRRNRRRRRPPWKNPAKNKQEYPYKKKDDDDDDDEDDNWELADADVDLPYS